MGQNGGRLYYFPGSRRLEAQGRGHQGGGGDLNRDTVDEPLVGPLVLRAPARPLVTPTHTPGGCAPSGTVTQ